jgi:DNA-directed RNA polymerase subunit alpha
VLQKNWQSLIKPYKLNVQFVDPDLREAEVVAEPLERGFGLTLGNSLRRILLSSIQGAAITAVKIDEVLHEFSTIPGVLEDVTDIVLNLKTVGVRLHSETSRKIRLSVTKTGPVKAGDIICPSEVEILDPEVVICTLDEGGKLWLHAFFKTSCSNSSTLKSRSMQSELQKPQTYPLIAICCVKWKNWSFQFVQQIV